MAGAGAALVGTAWAIEGGLNAASHLMGWGAATGGGTDSDASRPSMTTDARKRSRRSLLHPGAAEGPAAGGLQDRHGVGERAQESAAATDPKPPGTAPEAPGADPFRPEQRSHPRVLRQRTVPGQPPVPRLQAGYGEHQLHSVPQVGAVLPKLFEYVYSEHQPRVPHSYHAGKRFRRSRVH